MTDTDLATLIAELRGETLQSDLLTRAADALEAAEALLLILNSTQDGRVSELQEANALAESRHLERYADAERERDDAVAEAIATTFNYAAEIAAHWPVGFQTSIAAAIRAAATLTVNNSEDIAR